MDEIWSQRLGKVKKKTGEDSEEILSSEQEPKVKEEKVTKGPVNPISLLLGMYYARPQDLERLEKEQEQHHRLSQYFNKAWVDSQPSEGGEDANELRVYGSVTLTENEKNLLKLGPDYMVL